MSKVCRELAIKIFVEDHYEDILCGDINYRKIVLCSKCSLLPSNKSEVSDENKPN